MRAAHSASRGMNVLDELALMENERKSLPVSGVNAELPS